MRTFVHHSRNTLDLSAVPVIRKESHLPIVIDPSHAAGRRDQVIPIESGGSGRRRPRVDGRSPSCTRRSVERWRPVTLPGAVSGPLSTGDGNLQRAERLTDDGIVNKSDSALRALSFHFTIPPSEYSSNSEATGMITYRISGTTGTSTILIGEQLQNLAAHLPDRKPIIITDSNVGRLYAKNFPPAPVITLEPGEPSKSLTTIDKIYDRLLDLEADRSGFIVGIGGGVVCDIAGFVASTYMRGLRFGYVATSLLAQVDASVGGKNGVNYRGYKNLVGTFNQPEFVICDPHLLKTLPEKEVLCGLAEVVKHALIKDPALLVFLEQNGDGIRSLAADVIERLVSDSVAIKSAVVNQDEKRAECGASLISATPSGMPSSTFSGCRMVKPSASVWCLPPIYPGTKAC